MEIQITIAVVSFSPFLNRFTAISEQDNQDFLFFPQKRRGERT